MKNKKRQAPDALPKRSVEIEAFIVDSAEKRAQYLGLGLEHYIGNLVSIGMDKHPLPEEQRQIDEFLAEPGRSEWLDGWRQKNALKDPPTMADIAAAQKAEEREARYEYLKEKHS